MYQIGSIPRMYVRPIRALSIGIVSVSLTSAFGFSQTPVQYEQQKLTASDSEVDDFYGRAVAVSGNFAVVGAFNNDGKLPNAGAGYVYQHDGSSWVFKQQLFASDGRHNDGLGEDVDIDGDVIVMGAGGHDDIGFNAGAAYVYRYDAGTWVEEAELKAPDAAANDLFGHAVDVSGDAIIVGAFDNDDAGSRSGSAYVYRYDGTDWNFEQKLTASDAGIGERFGEDVAISGNTVAVGALGAINGGIPGAGAVYIYTFDGSTWGNEVKLIASDANASHSFGDSVALEGDLLIVGDTSVDTIASDTGAAYIFWFNGSTWTEQVRLVASDAVAFQNYGWSVAILGDTAVVGAPTDDQADTDAGAVYLYKYDGTSSWVETTKFLASDAGATGNSFGLGAAVDLTSSVVFAGAPFDVALGFNSGAAYAFNLNTPPVAVCSAGPTTGDGETGSNITLECDRPAGRDVTLDGTASFDPDDDTLTYHWDVSDLDVVLDDPDSAVAIGTFPIGVTMATLTIADGNGGVDTCDVTVTVHDTTPPEVACTTDIASLWPPNHKMKDIEIYIVATDACTAPEDILPVQVTIRSDEPDNAPGNGDGNTTGDVNGLDGYISPVNITSLFTYNSTAEAWVASIELRAERAGSGDGRSYIIDVSAIDSQMNIGTASCVVVVPHDRRNK